MQARYSIYFATWGFLLNPFSSTATPEFKFLQIMPQALNKVVQTPGRCIYTSWVTPLAVVWTSLPRDANDLSPTSWEQQELQQRKDLKEKDQSNKPARWPALHVTITSYQTWLGYLPYEPADPAEPQIWWWPCSTKGRLSSSELPAQALEASQLAPELAFFSKTQAVHILPKLASQRTFKSQTDVLKGIKKASWLDHSLSPVLNRSDLLVLLYFMEAKFLLRFFLKNMH